MLKPRSVLLASVCLLPAMLAAPGPTAVAQAATPANAPIRTGGTIAAIQVTGNKRIETSTIIAYMVAQPGQPFSQEAINQSVKTLYATGLFKSVNIARSGNNLDVSVVENPTVNQVLFSGNSELSDKDAQAALSLKPRAVYTPAAAEADRRALLNAYAKKGYYNAEVTANIIKLPDNRVNVVFQCNEGHVTDISRITFVGNKHFSQSTLRGVISSRQSAWWRFLSSADQFNSDRVEYDEYLLHKFYFHKGYANFQVVSVNANLSPDRKSFYLAYTVDEGARYKIGSIKVVSNIHNLTESELRGLVPLSKGDWFDGDALQEGVEALNKRALNLGYAFATVNPDVTLDHKNHTVNIVLNVVNGPRVWIQRIDIVGNTRTEDKVIRRELTVAEGDAYNQSQIDQSTKNIKNLGFFKNVKMSTDQGSTPQQVVLKTSVQEQATGQFSLGGGYSTSLGALLNTGLSQNNFIGTGINASINALIAQHGTQINVGMTDPYFLDRNLIAGWDIFRTVTNSYTNTSQNYAYSESNIGADIRLGYRFNQNVQQTFTYTVSSRNIYDIPTGSSTNIYIESEAGKSSLSQLSQTLSFDYLDSDQDPHSGLLLNITTDLAGLGGDAKYFRINPNLSYYIPLEHVFGNPSWVLKLSASAGYLVDMRGYQDKIEDRFFLGGDSLRGFADGGVGPYVEPVYNSSGTLTSSGGQVGGRYMWTQSTELHFPLPVSKDLGVSGFAFVDVGSLWGASTIGTATLLDSSAPRVGAGVGVSWNTPFGLINLSLAQPVVKQRGDQVQQFRVSFGTRF
ncbi:outer membrane protein assembly factor BamA [Acidocella aminolytica]|uniref:Outer membrane protein assembly factor BamA n=2 Tax=Acidocella TaxID=50709 RepID=A0A0D6PCK4_9PROT|nr:outer membrane protein assembly factor BamA [Acidocella aminolytica]GAN78938.1 outer membrane protein [Acidocella aminolytica 101 = DSM 11237]SHE99747.1 Beta-barrel assembly machine subunit BamA [Acidocella aminolytica 101 = DSM 11237]